MCVLKLYKNQGYDKLNLQVNIKKILKLIAKEHSKKLEAPFSFSFFLIKRKVGIYMKMKKFLKSIALIMSIVMVFALLTACGGGKADEGSTDKATGDNGEEVSETLQKLRKKGVLKVGSSGDIYAYIDKDTGEFSGIDAVIIKEAARRLGIDKVEMELIPFSELILNLNSGNIDMITDAMYIKADRAKQICYGEVWYTQGGGLVVPEKSDVNGVEDFDPAKTTVGYTTGTVWQGIVEQWEKDGKIKKAVATGDQTESLIALQYGKIDAFLTDSTVVEDLFTNSPDTVKGLRLCDNFTDTDDTLGHIAPSVKKGDDAFMKEVNDVIVEMRNDGFLEKAFKECGLDPKLHMITNEERVYEPKE